MATGSKPVARSSSVWRGAGSRLHWDDTRSVPPFRSHHQAIDAEIADSTDELALMDVVAEIGQVGQAEPVRVFVPEGQTAAVGFVRDSETQLQNGDYFVEAIGHVHQDGRAGVVDLGQARFEVAEDERGRGTAVETQAVARMPGPLATDASPGAVEIDARRDEIPVGCNSVV